MNIFEITMYFMSLIRGKNISIDKVKDVLTDMINDDEFLSSIGNGRDNNVNVKRRFDMAEAISGEVIDD